ncbi:hypothetical protein PG985_011064 [Apiospora marii]|uniref:2EXR domain-containing protein n=1 Tax=Apiospora marii TaxID=335849 RepID=A0ABR1SSL8_9PEZI
METFHSFPKLPIELRWLVWTSYLQQPRIITLQLTPQSEPSDRPYLVEMRKLYRPSTLLSVNQESRRAAQEFLTLRVTCDNTTVPLYCNPAFDTLFIHQGSQWGLEHIADFLPKLVEQDSRGVGVLNLAIDRTALRDLEKTRTRRGFRKAPIIDKLEAPARRAFTKSLRRLQRLWIMYIEGTKTRRMGPLEFMRFGVHHNRSVPVFPEVQSFQRLAVDPRPIKSDLRYIGQRYSPRWTLDAWRTLEKQLRVNRKTALEFRVALAVDSSHQPITDRPTAQQYFEADEQEFREECCKRFNLNTPHWGTHLDREEWEDPRGRLQDVVGFWLFTPAAFDESSYGWDIVRDLTKHPPELCVSDLGN